MSQSLEEQFWAAIDPPRKKPVLLRGVQVFAEEIGGDEWLEIRLESFKATQESEDRKDPLADARLAARSLTDGNGKLIIGRDEATLRRFMRLPLHELDRIMAVVNEVNFAGDKWHEEAKKNSEATPASSSASPETSAASTGAASSSGSGPGTSNPGEPGTPPSPAATSAAIGTQP